MANVKVPALLHKMSKAAQKAWYKKNNMTMPSEVEGGGRSAAAAKRVVAPAPRKQMAAAPQSVRAMNTARQQAYYAKGGRQPIGAGGSGGSSSMAGVGQSSAKEIIKGIKAGYNPKVALVRYTNEEAEQVDEVTKKEAEETLGGPVKTKPKMPPGKQPEGYRYVRALARRAMKAGLKKEEVEQIDEISPGLARKAAAASQVKAIEFSDYSGLSNLHNKEGKKEANRLNRKSDKAMDYIGKRQGQKGVDKVNRMVTRVVGEEVEQVDEAGYQVVGTTKDKETFRSKVHPKKAEALSTHYKMAKSRKYKDIKLVKVQKEAKQVDEADYKKYLKASQEKRPLTMKSVDSALAADKAGDPNPLRKLGNTNAARKFAQKQLTKKFNASQPARPFPVYEPGRTYVGDSVEHDGPVIDEARRMSAAEKLGRAFDSEQQRSALSRQRGLDLLKQKDTEKMQNKPASGNMTKLKKEETEESTMKYIEEKLTAADPASKWISDFVKSDNPKFAGKSKKERIQQALGAYYAKKRGTNEEVEQVDEVNRNKTKTDDYGGRYLDSINRDKEIKELERKISKMSPNDGGGRYLAGLKLDKMKAMKEEVEQVFEQDDTMEKKEMAQTQLHFIKYAAEEILGFIKMGGEIEEWYQNKLSKVQSEVESLHSYIEGEKRRTGMVEEAEQVDELRASTYASASNKRQAQAGTAAKVGANHASRVLQDKSDKLAYSAAMTGQREFLKTLSPATKRVMSKEEAEGKVAVTPKEKSLAAHHGDKTKITFGDVLKARLKSAAAKKMGK